MNKLPKFLIVLSMSVMLTPFGSANAQNDTKKDPDITTIDVGEIVNSDEIEIKSDDSIDESKLSASNPVMTSCHLTNKSGNFYRTAKIIARNRTNSTKTCTFTCNTRLINGRNHTLRCRASVLGGQSATVCSTSGYRFQAIISVNDSNPC